MGGSLGGTERVPVIDNIKQQSLPILPLITTQVLSLRLMSTAPFHELSS